MSTDHDIDRPAPPGISVFERRAGGVRGAAGFESVGPVDVRMTGRLGSRAAEGDLVAFLDGALTEPHRHPSDAAAARAAGRRGGAAAVQALRGFYNVLVIDQRSGESNLISDLTASRPWYVYEGSGGWGAAPSPVQFAALDLSMTLDRQALYELIRLQHTGLDRTLAAEVTRMLPGRALCFAADGGTEQVVLHRFRQDLDSSLTVDDAAEWLTDICRTEIRGLLGHPSLAGLSIHLPLTGGLDSRHLLGELIAHGRPPDAIRHIRIREADFEPVRQMAERLGIELIAPRLDELDIPGLVRRWAYYTGGLVNVHQFYLAALTRELPSGGALALDGYLMDWLLGVSPKSVADADHPHRALLDRTYTGPAMLRLILPDAAEQHERTVGLFEDEITAYEGAPWFRMMMMDLHHRGLHYTGVVDGLLGDELQSFSPAASRESIRFVQTVPRETAGERRGRLLALNRHFPELAAFPGPRGIPYAEMDVLEKRPKSPIRKNIGLLLRALAGGWRTEPDPESEHAWLRRIDDLHRMHRRVVIDGALIRDGHVRAAGVRASWNLLRAGGYQGWTLMSILTAEVAYRTLVLKQRPDAVVDWLSSDD